MPRMTSMMRGWAPSAVNITCPILCPGGRSSQTGVTGMLILPVPLLGALNQVSLALSVQFTSSGKVSRLIVPPLAFGHVPKSSEVSSTKSAASPGVLLNSLGRLPRRSYLRRQNHRYPYRQGTDGCLPGTRHS